MEQIKIIEMNEMQLGYFVSKEEDQDYRDKMIFDFCEINDIMPSELKIYYFFSKKETVEISQNITTYILLCDDDILPKNYMKLELETGKYLTFLAAKEDLKNDPTQFMKTLETYLQEHQYRLDRKHIAYIAERQDEHWYRVFIAIG